MCFVIIKNREIVSLYDYKMLILIITNHVFWINKITHYVFITRK